MKSIIARTSGHFNFQGNLIYLYVELKKGSLFFY